MFYSQIALSFLTLAFSFISGEVKYSETPYFSLSGKITPNGYIFKARVNGLKKENGSISINLGDINVINREYSSLDSQVIFAVSAKTGLLSYKGFKNLAVTNYTSSLNESLTYKLRGFEQDVTTSLGLSQTEVYLIGPNGENIIYDSYELAPNESFVLPRNIDFSTNKMFYLTMPNVSYSNLSFFLDNIPFQITKCDIEDGLKKRLTISGPNMNVNTNDSFSDMMFIIRLKNDVAYQDIIFKVSFPVIDLLGDDGLFNFHFEIHDS